MLENQEHYFEEDSLYKAINRFENMISSQTTAYFDVFEFEIIIDYYLDIHNFSKAEEAINFALNQHPGAFELKYRLAQFYVNSGKPAKGIRLLRDLEFLEATNTDFFLLKGVALNVLGKKDEATQAFSEAISQATDNKDETLFSIAQSYVSIRRYNDAIRYLKLAHEVNPQNMDVIHELALIYERTDELGESVIYYNKCLDLDPFNDSIWLNLGVIYAGLDLVDKSMDAFDYALAISPRNIAALYSKANTCVNDERFEEAIDTYNELLEIESDNAQIYTYIGECYEKMLHFKRSIYYFEKALSIEPNYADAWYGMGIATYQQELLDESITLFKKSVEIDPENPDFWFMLGETYRKQDNLKLAAEAYNRSVELDPNDYEAWICRADLSYKNNNDVDGAIDILKKAVEYNKDNSTINYQLSIYYFCKDNFDLACNYFEKGLAINYKEHYEYLDEISISRQSFLNGVQELIKKYKNNKN